MITKRFTLLLVVFTILMNQLNAQIYDWATFFTGGDIYSRHISNSSDGSVIVSGTFASSITCNSLSITANLGGISDVYFAKIDASGEIVWLNLMGSGSNDSAIKIITDTEGNIYAAMDTQGGAFILPNGLVLQNPTSGNYLIKFDTNGTFIWHKVVAGIQDITTDNNNVYAILFSGEIIKYSANDGLQEASFIVPTSNGSTIEATNDGRIAASVRAYGTATFPDNSTIYNSGMGIAINMFGDNPLDYAIVCLDTALNYLWSQQLCSSLGTATLTSDESGNIYTTLSISYEATIDDSLIATPPGNLKRKVIVSLDAEGAVSWIRTYDNDTDAPQAAIGTNDGVIICNDNYQTMTFSDGTTFSNGNQDAGIFAFAADGSLDYVDFVGRGVNSTTIRSLAKDASGNYYAAAVSSNTNFFIGCNGYEISQLRQFIFQFHPGDRTAPTPSIANNGGTLTATPEFNGTINWYIEGNTTPVASGAVFNPTQVGFYTVTYTNEYGCSSTSSTLLVQQLDSTAPEISCSTSAEVMAGELCTGLAQLEISATDNSGVPTITNSFNDQGGSVLADFPIGSTTIVFTATDIFGNASTCEVAVNVMDGDAPTITCPSNISAETFTNDIELTIGQAVATDNCSDVEVSNNFNATPDATGVFPEGTTVVTYTAVDAAGNTATCDVEVMVTVISAVIEQSVTIAELWPNPAQNDVTLRLNKPWYGQLNALNTEGRIVRSWNNMQSQNQQIQLSISDLPSGFYVLEGWGSEFIRTKLIVE